MLLLEIIGLVLLYTIWQIEKDDPKNLGTANVLNRMMIAGLFVLGFFFVVVDVLEFLLDITG